MVLLPLQTRGELKSLQGAPSLPLPAWFPLHLGDTCGSQPRCLSFLKLSFFPKTGSLHACAGVECQPGWERKTTQGDQREGNGNKPPPVPRIFRIREARRKILPQISN